EDLRESPAVQIVQRVAYEAPDTELIVLEPFITQLPNALSTNENVELIRKFECVNWPDYLHVFLVRHSQFGETLSNEWPGDRSNSLDFVGILDVIDLTYVSNDGLIPLRGAAVVKSKTPILVDDSLLVRF